MWLQLGLCSANTTTTKTTTTTIAMNEPTTSLSTVPTDDRVVEGREEIRGIGGIARRLLGDSSTETRKRETVSIWNDAKLQQDRFVPAPYVSELIQNEEKSDYEENNLHIQDVSLGDYQTLVLSSNKRSVSFGRCMEGQLGLSNDKNNKLFISPPKRSTLLSKNNDTEDEDSFNTNRGYFKKIAKGSIYAVCAVGR